MKRAQLLARLKAAYESNRIPVDDLTAKFHREMSTPLLLENAMYWEAKAAGGNAEDAIATDEAKKMLRAVCESVGHLNGTPAGRTIRYKETLYHGNSYRE